MTDAEQVILVDAADREVGRAEKLDAHVRGLLHRAISVFLFDADGRLLLQRRADGKYHTGGRWANTCCSHPRPDESASDAAARRLREEMGVTVELRHAVTFTYRADLGGLVENEIDHVFVGRFDGAPRPNDAEVGDWAWREIGALEAEIAREPERFAPWLALALNELRGAGRLPEGAA